jgi:glycerol-1-phosphate dehydrogenase [NAD(P)+]
VNDADVSAADPIAQLLRATWPDPDGGPPIGVPIDAIVIENSLRGAEADLVASLGFTGHIAVVSDPQTHAVLGARVERALASRVNVRSIMLDANPHADTATVDRVRAATASADALVAVGAGTVNDLCKYAAAVDRKPYAVFATAPSMNGYTSVNAAITVDGHKHTLAAAAPRGVFVDLEILAGAPIRLIRAGIGDSICRPTAQSDWLMSHELRDTPYRKAPFALLADDEPDWLLDPASVLRGDLDAVRALARTLLLSGLGMTLCKGSYPASQGEHLLSHYIDMFAPPSRPPFLHGEQVAVATLAMARLQERMLDRPAPVLHETAESEASIVRRFGESLGPSCWREFARKALSAEAAEELTERIHARWHGLANAIRPIALPSARIADVLRRAGAPATCAEIGVTSEQFACALRDARFLRDRFTFLDLAGDAGCLDLALA